MYTNETYINGKDIWLMYNARLIHDSFTNLLLPASRKEFVKNEPRNQPGKQLFINNPQPNTREIQLTFLLMCKDRIEFFQKYKKLVTELEKGLIELKVIPLSTIYKLTVDSYMSLDSHSNGGIGILVVKLDEANPKDIKSTLITAYTLSNKGKVLTSKTKIITDKIE